MSHPRALNKKLLLLILLIATFFRLFGLNWDQNQHLNPDERFLTMVVGSLSWPHSLGEYLNPSLSPLNPYNKGFTFYVYGPLPLVIVRGATELLKTTSYDQITHTGRVLASIFDIFTVCLVYWLAKKLGHSWQSGLSGMFLYSLAVLPIQNSHFFIVDVFAAFFLTLSLCFGIKLLDKKSSNRSRLFSAIGMGGGLGLAITCKISSLLFAPIVLLIVVSIYFSQRFSKAVLLSFIGLLFFCATIFFGQPYLFVRSSTGTFSIHPRVLANWKEQKHYFTRTTYNQVDSGVPFPPGALFIKAKPYLFPLSNMFWWGWGPPAFILVSLGLVYGIKSRRITTGLVVLWIVSQFLAQGGQFATYMRYFYPIYPPLAVLGGLFLWRVLLRLQKKSVLRVLILFSLFIWPISFIAIYSRPHSRITASEWIYKNVAPGSSIAGEHWDDKLPFCTPSYDCNQYEILEYPLYETDTPAKWDDMLAKLQETDYIVLSSNRLYGSISSIPEKYPITSQYYKSLFDGSLGFKLVAQFTSRPHLPLPGIKLCLALGETWYGQLAIPFQDCPLPGLTLVDDYADESFTVYDHPKILIFKKIFPADYIRLLKL